MSRRCSDGILFCAQNRFKRHLVRWIHPCCTRALIFLPLRREGVRKNVADRSGRNYAWLCRRRIGAIIQKRDQYCGAKQPDQYRYPLRTRRGHLSMISAKKRFQRWRFPVFGPALRVIPVRLKPAELPQTSPLACTVCARPYSRSRATKSFASRRTQTSKQKW